MAGGIPAATALQFRSCKLTKTEPPLHCDEWQGPQRAIARNVDETVLATTQGDDETAVVSQRETGDVGEAIDSRWRACKTVVMCYGALKASAPL